jgi:hypothetical protein
LTFSIIIGFMLGTLPVAVVCLMGATGRKRRLPVLPEKGAEDNREEEDPISISDVSSKAVATAFNS